MTSGHQAASRGKRASESQPTQLRLLDGGRATRRAWQLDARTRRIGRERVAEAREILRRAHRLRPVPTTRSPAVLTMDVVDGIRL